MRVCEVPIMNKKKIIVMFVLVAIFAALAGVLTVMLYVKFH